MAARKGDDADFTRTAEAMARVMALIRAHDAELPAQRIEALFHIAAHPDIPLRELQDKLAISSSSASRIAAEMGAHGRAGREPLRMVEAYEDLKDRRFKNARLTPKGRKLVEQIAAELRRT